MSQSLTINILINVIEGNVLLFVQAKLNVDYRPVFLHPDFQCTNEMNQDIRLESKNEIHVQKLVLKYLKKLMGILLIEF